MNYRRSTAKKYHICIVGFINKIMCLYEKIVVTTEYKKQHTHKSSYHITNSNNIQEYNKKFLFNIFFIINKRASTDDKTTSAQEALVNKNVFWKWQRHRLNVVVFIRLYVETSTHISYYCYYYYY